MKKKEINRNKQVTKTTKDKKNNILTIVTIIGICIICIFFASKSLQNDTFYTIKVGESILENGIDFKDHFSWQPNLAYTYPHWLYDVIIYIVYSKTGLDGLHVFTLIQYMLLCILMFKFNNKINQNIYVSSIMAVLAVVTLSSYAAARAQLVSYILFLIELYYIEKLLETRNKKYCLYLIIIGILLANIHAAVWPFFFVIFLPYLAENFIAMLSHRIKIPQNRISNIFTKRISISKDKNIKILILTMILCLFTGLITPIKDIPYTYYLRTIQGNSQEYILEHHALGWENYPPLIFLIVIIIVTILIFIFTKNKLKIRDLFMIAGLSLMAMISNRRFSLFIVVGTIYFSRILITFLINNKTILKELLTNSLLVYVVIGEIACISVIKYILVNEKYISEKDYPVKASDFILENLDVENIRLFNEYNFGSYLIYRGIPVFIDSRCDLYTKEFSGLDYDIFDDYMESATKNREIFRKYKITHAITYNGSAIFGELYVNKSYKVIYSDENFVIFEKK